MKLTEQSVMIVDDNKEFVSLLSEYINEQEDMSVYGIFHNGNDAIQYLQAQGTVPTVIILDLIMPGMDGLSVLENLKEMNILQKTKIIFVTAFGQESIIQKVSSFGTSYFLVKPLDIEFLVKRIREVNNESSNCISELNFSKNMPLKEKKLDLEKEVTTFLIDLGIPAHIKGYVFLREAIKMTYHDPSILGQITKILYPTIATSHNTTPTRVERAIRHAIQVAWERGMNDKDRILGNMFNNRHKPTNSAVIATIADRLKIEHKAV
jgi:two-component system response regulator (stage 0 sporulation protein A)